MNAISHNFPVYFIIGIAALVIISQFHRMVGAVLGVLFWSLVAIAGNQVYAAGHGLGVPGFEFSRSVFLAVCLFFILMNTYAGVVWLKRQRSNPPEED